MIRISIWLALCLLIPTAPAGAHPHAWIDLRSRVLLDERGNVHAIELDWLFDDYYTVLIAEELAAGGTLSEDYLRSISERNLKNLREYDYFTHITYNGEQQAVGDVSRYESGVRDGRLWMRFEVPLEHPLDPRAGALSYAIFDPTYYIEIVHLEGDLIAFEGTGAESCLGTINPPNPTMEQVSLAAALDRDETAGDGLGKLFAETVEVSCS